jgi:hypothetical protein
MFCKRSKVSRIKLTEKVNVLQALDCQNLAHLSPPAGRLWG